MVPPSFHIQQNDDTGRFQVLKNGVVVGEYRSRADAQGYIDTWRQAAARLKMETADELPLDGLTDEERKILDPDRRS